jgi:hypothetical protein
MNAFIRLLYALLIAVSVGLFVGISINSVYPGPKMPEYPSSNYASPSEADQAKYQKQQQDFDKQYKDFRSKEKNYQRNVSIIAVVGAVVIVALGLWYLRRNEIIGEGLALGGLGVGLYAVITAMVADHRIMRLVAVTILLASALLVVHRRFIEKPAVKKHA